MRRTLPCSALATVARVVTLPCGVYLQELETRLRHICMIQP